MSVVVSSKSLTPQDMTKESRSDSGTSCLPNKVEIVLYFRHRPAEPHKCENVVKFFLYSRDTIKKSVLNNMGRNLFWARKARRPMIEPIARQHNRFWHENIYPCCSRTHVLFSYFWHHVVCLENMFSSLQYYRSFFCFHFCINSEVSVWLASWDSSVLYLCIITSFTVF